MRIMAAIAFLGSAYLAVVEVFYKKALETGAGSHRLGKALGDLLLVYHQFLGHPVHQVAALDARRPRPAVFRLNPLKAPLKMPFSRTVGLESG